MLILIRASSEPTMPKLRRTPQPCQVSVLNNQTVLLFTSFLVVALSLGKLLPNRCGSEEPKQNSVFWEHLNLCLMISPFSLVMHQVNV